MRVAIIGAGGIGRGYAAFLASQGRRPVIWSPSGAALADFDGGIVLTTGRIETSRPLAVVRDCGEAVSGA